MDREKWTFEEAKQLHRQSRGALVDLLDLALQKAIISQKARDIVYFRLIDWNSLENTGRKFDVTRERIRQIEAKVEEKMRMITKNPEK